MDVLYTILVSLAVGMPVGFLAGFLAARTAGKELATLIGEAEKLAKELEQRLSVFEKALKALKGQGKTP